MTKPFSKEDQPQLADTRIGVYIDNNVWDFLFERRLDLCVELPPSEYRLCLTREAEFEIPPIPSHKAELKAFIEKTIEKCGVKTLPHFGFYDEKHPPDEQRMGGFDIGQWASKEELAFMEQQKARLSPNKKPKTGLYKNEADISLGARAFRSVVISLDRKSDPIRTAMNQGGKVIFLVEAEFDNQNESLGAFIKSKLANIA
jgi:hypothetical protein